MRCLLVSFGVFTLFAMTACCPVDMTTSSMQMRDHYGIENPGNASLSFDSQTKTNTNTDSRTSPAGDPSSEPTPITSNWLQTSIIINISRMSFKRFENVTTPWNASVFSNSSANRGAPPLTSSILFAPFCRFFDFLDHYYLGLFCFLDRDLRESDLLDILRPLSCFALISLALIS